MSRPRRQLHDDRRSATEQTLHQSQEWAYRTALQLCPAARTALDVGCSLGYGTKILAKGALDVVGLDSDEGVLALAASTYPELNFVVSFDELPRRHFDMVTAFQVLEHVPEPDAFLAQIKSVLRPGGGLFLTTPDARYRLRPGQTPWNPEHVREYRPEELRALVVRAGFRVEVLSTVEAAPWVMALHRAKVRRAQTVVRWDPLKLHRKIPWHWVYPAWRRFLKFVDPPVPPRDPNFTLAPAHDRPGLDLWITARRAFE